MADSPWVRRVMRAVNVLGRNSARLGALRPHDFQNDTDYQREWAKRRRRVTYNDHRLRALLREKEDK